jgi:pyruvate,water dikinase
MELIARLREAPEGATSTKTMQRLEGVTAREAKEKVLARCGRGPLGWLKRRVLGHVLWLAQRYVPLREEQRFYWQKTLAWMRTLFLRLGQQMADAGMLLQKEDVFFLTKAELEPVGQGKAPTAHCETLAAGRREEFARLSQEFQAAPAWAYPPFLQGNQPLPTAAPVGETRLLGRGVSPGLARGPAVVLFSPSELARVKPGSVLVTRSVDPGWTPVFSLLSALVTEHGGHLSHGAVVAREYGLPAVTGVAGVTQLLHDGDEVVVDGLNGVVARVEVPSTNGRR